jgi:hypothetical protein
MSNVYNENFNAGKLQVTGNVYLGVDSSGIFHPDTSSNTASLDAVLVRAQTVSANTIYATNLSFANLDLSGSQVIAANLTVNGVTTLNGPTTVNDNTNLVGNVDVSGAVVAKSVSALTLATPGGFSVDASGRVVASLVNASKVVASSVDVSGALVAVSVTTGPVVAVSVDVSGALVASSVSAKTLATPGGFSVDASGRVLAVSVNASKVVASSVDVSGALVAVSVTTGPVVAVSVDVSGALVASSVSAKTLATEAGFSVDASGRMVVPGSTQLTQLTASGNALFNQSVNIDQSLHVAGGAYINTEYTNVLTVGDSSNGNGVTMKSTGTTLKVLGVTQDLSANVFPVSVNITGDMSTTGGFSVDASGAVVARSVSAKTLSTPGGFSVDASGAVVSVSVSTGAIVSSSSVSAKTVSTPGGFSVDASGAVVSTSLVTGPISTAAGFVVDVSANVVVPGELTVNSTSLFNDSVAIDTTLYVAEGSYTANEYASRLTVGNALYENGVTMESSGTTLNVFGVTQDTSAILFPINVNVNGAMSTTGGFSVDASGAVVAKTISTPGGFSVDASGRVVAANVNVNGELGVQNSYKFNVFTDSSTNKYINIDSSNTTVPTIGTQVPDYSMPIYINGEAYLINLKKL